MRSLIEALFRPSNKVLGAIPFSAAPYFACGLLILVLLWALMLKKDYIYLGAPDRALWRDLRIWAVLATLPYLAIYMIL